MQKRRYGEKVEIPTIEQVSAERRRNRYKAKYRRVLRSTLSVLIVVAALSVLVVTLIMPVLQISGMSMSPTLHDGEIVLSVKGTNFNTGDLIAFYHGNKLLVKRCIAGPFEWVDIDEDGNLYVNDELLDEPYITEKALGECDIELPYQVPDERWFVVGDNRAVSVDSRSSQIGCITEEQIVGKVSFRVWPITKFGYINK